MTPLSTQVSLVPVYPPRELYHSMCILACSVVSNSLTSHRLTTRPLCQWDFPGKNTGVSCHFLLQGIFLTIAIESESPSSPALVGRFFYHQAILTHKSQKMHVYFPYSIPARSPRTWNWYAYSLSLRKSSLPPPSKHPPFWLLLLNLILSTWGSWGLYGPIHLLLTATSDVPLCHHVSPYPMIKSPRKQIISNPPFLALLGENNKEGVFLVGQHQDSPILAHQKFILHVVVCKGCNAHKRDWQI